MKVSLTDNLTVNVTEDIC